MLHGQQAGLQLVPEVQSEPMIGNTHYLKLFINFVNKELNINGSIAHNIVCIELKKIDTVSMMQLAT